MKAPDRRSRSAVALLAGALLLPVAAFPEAPASRGGQIVQTVDATPYRGRLVTLHGAGRAEVSVHESALMRLRVHRKDGSVITIADQHDPITSREWRPYELSGHVPADAERLEIDLGLTGAGRVFWDDLNLEVDRGAEVVPLENGGFETAGEGGKPAGWEVDPDSQRAGYVAVVTQDYPWKGRNNLMFFYRKPSP